MSKIGNRKFEQNQSIYVVDCWGTNKGTQAFAAYAEILQVDELAQKFSAVLYGDTYQTYSFNDYGILIFDTFRKATIVANNLPSPTSLVYQKIGNRVYKKIVRHVDTKYVDGVIDLVIELNKGKNVSIKEIGNTIFLNESDARRK